MSFFSSVFIFLIITSVCDELCTILISFIKIMCIVQLPRSDRGSQAQRVHDPSAVIEAQVMIFCTVNKQCRAVKITGVPEMSNVLPRKQRTGGD